MAESAKDRGNEPIIRVRGLGNRFGEMAFRIGCENPKKAVRVRTDQIPKIG